MRDERIKLMVPSKHKLIFRFTLCMSVKAVPRTTLSSEKATGATLKLQSSESELGANISK